MLSKAFFPLSAINSGNQLTWLPYTFERFLDEKVLVTNFVGEHLVLTNREFELLSNQDFSDSELNSKLLARHIVRKASSNLPLELLALKYRTQISRLPEFTALHIFVVSLRCEHSCPYCQVSRQLGAPEKYDMDLRTAERALRLVFRSPSRNIKIEFQGGEPLMNFGLIKHIVLEAELLNQTAGRNLAFVIATNLALLDDEILDFCSQHSISVSTSLDGPHDIHNRNRPRPGNNSFQLATQGIERVHQKLGRGSASALMTTTQESLGRGKEIIDTYVENGLNSIFLRPLSPYGFAIKKKGFKKYDVADWLKFYSTGLDYILELNKQGVKLQEVFATIILRKLLSNDDPGYVDLMTPAGIGISAIVYNYNGDVYASDESRMLAEMGDETFRIGNLLENTYEEILLSSSLLDPLEQSMPVSAPMCSDCAFLRMCGADPVGNHTLFGDPVGKKPLSPFCQRNKSVFSLLIDKYENDPAARQIFLNWIDPR
jgi:uncharacterized protein